MSGNTYTYVWIKNNSITSETITANSGDAVTLQALSITLVPIEFADNLNLALFEIVGYSNGQTDQSVLYDATGTSTNISGLTVTVPAYTVVCTQGIANQLVAVTLQPNQVLYRSSSGDAIIGLDLNVTNSRPYDELFTLTIGNMLLATLANAPDIDNVEVYFNGLLLSPATDYVIVNNTITASIALNTAYGGNSNDGIGFTTNDLVRVIYYATLT